MTKPISPKIVITDIEGESIDIELAEARRIGAQVVRGNCTPQSPDEEVLALVKTADVILLGYANITRRIIKGLKRCKVIVCYGIGYNNVDVRAATEKGIYVVNLPTYCIEEVATHTVALMLALVRKLFLFDQDVRSGRWDYQLQTPISRLAGSRLGVVGFGNIARLVVEKMAVFGVQPLGYDPFIDGDVFRKFGVEPTAFDQLVRQSDIIFLAVPLTPSTRNLFGKAQFEAMKNSAYIVNTARGGIIDEQALYHALTSGSIAGAALDVMASEPPGPKHPLFELENIIITPHAAFYSETSLHNLHLFAVREAVRALQGAVPENVVNQELIKSK